MNEELLLQISIMSAIVSDMISIAEAFFDRRLNTTTIIRLTIILKMQADKEQAKAFVKKCISIGHAFEKLHGMRGDDLKEDELDLDIILPYLVLHAKDNRTLFTKLSNMQPGFRISSMINIYNAQIQSFDENNIKSVENLDSLTDGQKVWCFRRDLQKLENGEQCEILSLPSFSRYLSTIFPILYNMYKDEFSFSTFVKAVLQINDNAILATCMAFPQFIIPIMNQTADPLLKAKIAVMSPQLRPALLPNLNITPKIHCGLLVHFFKSQAPEFLLVKLGCNFNGVSDMMQDLVNTPYSSEAYYMCIARFCACEMAVRESETDRLLKCNDSKLLAALFFYVRSVPPSRMDRIFDRFTKNKESFVDMMLFYSEIFFENTGTVMRLTQKYLGPSFTEVKNNVFFREVAARQYQIISYLQPFAADHPKCLQFIGSLIGKTSEGFTDTMALAINSLETVTKNDFKTLVKFVTAFSAQDQISDIVESIIREKPFFDVDNIRKNPAPATAAALLVLLLKQTKSKKLLQRVPIRLILSACSQYEVFYNYCHGARGLFEFADDEPFMSVSINDIQPKIPLLDLLEIIKRDPAGITEETFNEWKVHHFINSFVFVVQTLEALGAPMKLSNLQFVFKFDTNVLSNDYALKILLVCAADLISVDEGVVEASVFLLLCDAIDHFADSRINRETLGWFINTLLRKTKRFQTLIDKGIKETVINEFGEYVRLTDEMAEELKQSSEGCRIEKIPRIAATARVFAKKFGQKIIPPIKAICTRLTKIMEKEEISFTQDWIVDITKSLADIAIMIPSIHAIILELIIRIMNKFSSILSEENINSITTLKNNMTASLFTIE